MRLSLGVCGITLVRADHFPFDEGERYMTMDQVLLIAGKRRLSVKASARQAKKNRKKYKRENPSGVGV